MSIRDDVNAIYMNNDSRTLSWRVAVGPDSGAGWTDITRFVDVQWEFSIGRVPQLRMHSNDREALKVKNIATFFKNVVLYVGFNGLNLVQFAGRILDLNTNDRQLEVTAEGSSWPLDVPFHKIILAFDNLENNLAMTQILDLAVVADYDVAMPTRQLGAVVPQVLSFATYGEALQKVADLGGGAWWETPEGIIKLRPLYVIDQFNTYAGASRTYWRGAMIGSDENPPVGAVGRPRVDAWHMETKIRDTKNRCFVSGANRQVVNSDGSVDNIPTDGEAEAASGYILNPDGTQAFNDVPFQSPLIDADVTAGTEAARVVNFENGLHEYFSVYVRGDPMLQLRQNIRLIDAERQMDRFMVVTGYTSRIASGRFSSSITALNINSADAAMIGPIAAFGRGNGFNDLESVDGAMLNIVSIDGSSSMGISSPIVTYAFVDNQTPHVINQSGSSATATGAYDSSVSAPLKVTLTVTDANGQSDSITLTVPVVA